MAKRIWGDDERAEVGERHRSEVFDLEEAVDTNEFEDHADITKPVDLMEADPDSPLTKADGVRLWERIDRVKVDAKRTKRTTADRILRALGKRPPADRLNSLDFKMKIVWGLLIFALTGAGAAVTQIFGYVGDQREMSVTVKRLIDQNVELSGRLRSVEDSTTRSAQRLEDLIQRLK
jgi:hypothetical protein